jgi:hypothetical protein
MRVPVTLGARGGACVSCGIGQESLPAVLRCDKVRSAVVLDPGSRAFREFHSAHRASYHLLTPSFLCILFLLSPLQTHVPLNGYTEVTAVRCLCPQVQSRQW